MQRKSKRASKDEIPEHWHPQGVAPSSPVAFFFWRWKLWFDASIGVSLLDPVERIFSYFLLLFMFGLVFLGIVRYLPSHLMFLQKRARYYFLGEY